jgi:ATP-dependent DNA helicase DinG
MGVHLEDTTKYIILDFETTNFRPDLGEIWEIAAIKMSGLEIEDEFHTFVAISAPLPSSSKRLSKVDDSILTGAPTLEVARNNLLKFIGNLQVVAHNAKFEEEWFNYHIGPRAGFHDTMDVFALVLSDLRSLSEDNLRVHFGIQNPNSHRAVEDCKDLIDLLKETKSVLLHDRSEVLTIHRKFLASTNWFWNWFFESPIESRPIEDALDSQKLGDLRELIKSDLNKQVVPVQNTRAGIVTDLFRKAAAEGSGVKFRPQQNRLALEITSALERQERIAVEAPTGTGKSLGYLVPSAENSLQTGVPVVVSTHTKELQDQILHKDKFLLDDLRKDNRVKLTVVKGQANYFCLRKLFDLGEELLGDPKSQRIETRWAIAYLYCKAVVSPTAEVPENRFTESNTDLHSLLIRVRSSRDTTIGKFCPHFSYCRFYNSARKAHDSDIIVANHALAFSWPKHLPAIRKIVFDEAHHLEDEITEAFSETFSSFEIAEMFKTMIVIKKSAMRGVLGRMLTRISEMKDAPSESVERLSNKVSDFYTLGKEGLSTFEEQLKKLVESESIGRFSISVDLTEISSQTFWLVANDFAQKFSGFQEYFKRVYEWVKDRAPDDRLMREFAMEVSRMERISRVLGFVTDRENMVFFREIQFNPNQTWALRVSPIRLNDLANKRFEEFKTVVLTSATLSVPGRPSFIPNQLGLKLTRPFVPLQSEFNLADQGILFFPKDLKHDPGSIEHQDELVAFTEAVVRRIGGRTLLLMCSRERRDYVIGELKSRLRDFGIEVVQSVTAFKENPAKSVLVGLEKLGEGVDIPGQDLTCVIVEKVNEAMTMKPLIKLRADNPATNGGNGFLYNFSKRLIWLKQRIGRLVRTETDRGWVVVFDPRYERWKENTRKFISDGVSPMPVKLRTPEEILTEIDIGCANIFKEDVG